MTAPPRKKVPRPEYLPLRLRQDGKGHDPGGTNVTTSIALRIDTLMAVDALAYDENCSRNKILRRAVELGVSVMQEDAPPPDNAP